MARARVKWGNSRFWRINEFASEEDAIEFVDQLRKTHDPQSVSITIERLEGDRWVPIVSP